MWPVYGHKGRMVGALAPRLESVLKTTKSWIRSLAALIAVLAPAILMAGPAGLSHGHVPAAAIDLVVMPGIDLPSINAQDDRRDAMGLPLRVAIPNECSITPATRGTWEHLANDRMMWRLRVHSPGAAHLNFGFEHIELPHSASLTIYSLDGLDVTDTYVRGDLPVGQWWTRVILSDDVVIEVTVDSQQYADVKNGLRLSWINEGYRGLGAAPHRGSSESCNIDVVCEMGDTWWDEIPSVGVYTVQGSWTCTGVMVNNTAEDQRPLFMTSDQCGINNGNDQSVVIYWNHQNSYCRTPGSGDSGGSGDGHLQHVSSGTTFLADNSFYDATIVELNTAPSASWGVTFAGWSRTNMPSNGAGIHHPECAEKRISFPDTTSGAGQYWRVNWGDGRTAPGSSGSPLFDSNHRVIGLLCCGSSYCWNDDDDYYGRSFGGAWPDFSPWLDPAGSNPAYLDTLNPDGGGDPQGACCTLGTCTYVTAHDCTIAGGTWQGEGTSCAGNPCDPHNGDLCETAQVASEGANAFDTSSATDSGYAQPDEDQCPDTYLDWDDSPDHWFRWLPPGTGTLTIDTCDASSYDTSLVLYEGLDCNSLTQIGCNGDEDDPPDECQDYVSSIMDIPVTTGETYWVRIGGWQGATGSGTLNITYDGTLEATGGCCSDEECAILTGPQCTAVGGNYLGDDTTCLGDPCNSSEDTGACCIGGVCSIETQSNCELLGGNFTSVGVDCSPNPCGTTGENVAIRWSVVGTDLVSTAGDTWTVDIYAQLPELWRLDAVAGNSLQLKTIASTTSFYQDPYGGATSTAINPDFYPLAPDLQWDSRVTIGCIDNSGDPFGENTLGDIGIDWTDFEDGGDLSVDDGTWFILPVDAQGESTSFTDSNCDDRNGVLIARLTSLEHSSEILFDALFQGRDTSDSTWQDTASATIVWNGETDCNTNGIPDACDIANGDSDDDNGNGIPDECESDCPGDYDGDGDSDVDDVLWIITGFGTEYDIDDLLNCLADFGC